MSTTQTVATILAVYDTRNAAIQAADAVAAARIPGSVVNQIDSGADAAAELKLLGLSADAADRCLEHLAVGRSLVAVEADPGQSAAVAAILEMQAPTEVSTHAGDRTDGGIDGALPASIRSTAAQTGLPRGHRDPSA